MSGKAVAVTLDLESDHSGLLKDEYRIFNDRERIKELLEYFKKEGVKLSLFVVGELLEKYPEMVKLYTEYECEFHCHSYTHDPNAADSEEEITKSKAAFVKFFNKEPLGYRAPLGKISDRGIETLGKNGFVFDASIFPTYFPNPFKYIHKKKYIHNYNGSKMVEIPSTPISPLRLAFSLSYIKLLGYRAFQFLFNISRLPGSMVFVCHLHDCFTQAEQVKKLSYFWQRIYSRNRDKGLEYLARMIGELKDRGYSFCYISDLYKSYKSNQSS